MILIPRPWIAALTVIIASPASAQHLAGDAGPDISIMRVTAAFIVCLAAVVVVALALRHKLGSGGPAQQFSLGRIFSSSLARASRRIDVLEVRRVSLHADLCLIRCDGTEYLIVCGPSGHEVLARKDGQLAASGDLYGSPA